MKCKSCEYEWQPRVANPKACPRCKARTDAPKILCDLQKELKQTLPALLKEKA